MRPLKRGMGAGITDPTTREAVIQLEDAVLDAGDALARVGKGQLPTSGGGGGSLGVTNHHLLTNLTDGDDHTQYLFLAGRTGGQTILSTAAADIPLIVKGFSGQTGSLQRWLNSSGTLLASCNSAGHFFTNKYWTLGATLFSSLEDNLLTLVGSSVTSSTLADGALTFTNGVTTPTFVISGGRVYVGGNSGSHGQVRAGLTSQPIQIIGPNDSSLTVPALRIGHNATGAQTGDLTQWRNQADSSTLAKVDKDGNITAPTITATTGFSGPLATLTTRGDLLTRDASSQVRLAIGSSGKYLRTDGTDPSWAVVSESDVAVETPSVLARVLRNETIGGNWYFDNANAGRALGVLSSGGLGNDDGKGFAITDGTYWAKIGIDSGSASSDVELTLPTASARLVGSSEAVTITNKRLGGGTKLQCGASLADSTNGTFFSRSTSTSIGIRLNLGALTTNIKDWTGQNFYGTLPLVGDVTTAASGKLVKVDSGTQTADIASTNLTSTPGAGMYVIHWTLETVATDITAGAVSLTVGWTGSSAWTTTVGALSLATSGHAEGSFPVTVVSGDIAYSTSHTGVFGTGSYKLTIRVEALG